MIVGNRSGYIGAGVFGGNAVNCTIVSNVAAAYNAGVSGTLTWNSIVYYNLAYGTTPDSGIASYTNCCLFPTSGAFINHVITNEPGFVNLPGLDLHLAPWSPCINAGNDQSRVTGQLRCYSEQHTQHKFSDYVLAYEPGTEVIQLSGGDSVRSAGSRGAEILNNP